jgi:prevent-host-death family protein
MEIAISEFKAKCIQVLKQASVSDEEWIVTLRGKPLARVVGLKTPGSPRVLGGQREALDSKIPDSVLIQSDLDSDWEA